MDSENIYSVENNVTTKLYFIEDPFSIPSNLVFNKYSKLLIISENIIFERYKTYIDNFIKQYELYIIESGDYFKNYKTIEEIIKYLLFKNFDKQSCIIGFGGGKISDIAGYVSSIFMRGIDNILIPTTLLCMVDASIGGKTGINELSYGKNLIGSINQPRIILINLWMIIELEDELISDGLAEIIKIFIMFDINFFEILERYNLIDLRKEPELLFNICKKAIDYKINVIKNDVRDNNIRNVLNFGHTIGHAIESCEAFNLSHGKSVAIGLVLETQIAINLGYCKLDVLLRLKQTLENYDLPTEIPSYIDNYNLVDKIKNDKKNSNNMSKIVIIEDIGKLMKEYTISLSFDYLSNFLCNKIFIEKINSKNFDNSLKVKLKGSKSICNRALILSSLAKGNIILKNFLFSEDTNILIKCLRKLKVEITIIDDNSIKIVGNDGCFDNINSSLFVENAGTVARFITSLCALSTNSIIDIDGNSRMKERPICELLDVFKGSNVKIEFLELENRIPFRIFTGDKLNIERVINIKSKNSSQFITSLLLSSPYFDNDTSINLIDVSDDEIPVSYQYIEMTIKMMKQWGVDVKLINKNRFFIKKSKYSNKGEYNIEPDASTANFYLTIIGLHGGYIEIDGIGKNSIQGDSKFVDFMQKISNKYFNVIRNENNTILQSDNRHINQNIIFDEDLSLITDSFLAFGVLCSQIRGEFNFRGIKNQALKECDRLETFCLNLNKIGVFSYVTKDGVYINSNIARENNLNFVEIISSNDHRMAMSFAILGSYLKNTKIFLDNKRCVDKTYPDFWIDFEKLFGLKYTIDKFDINKSIFKLYNKNYLNSPIFLIGMRSSGKTTFGKTCSEILNLKFLDMDQYLLNKYNYESINYIVQNFGWKKFREMEIETFLEIFQNSNYYAGHIIACGGGIVENENILNALKSFEQVIFIDTNLDSIKRIIEIKNHNTDKPAFDDSLENIYNSRIDKYKYCSKYIFKTPYIEDFLNLEDIVKRISIIFSNFVYLNCGPMKYPLPAENSYFVCILYDDNLIQRLIEIDFSKYDCIELRVDFYINKLLEENIEKHRIVELLAIKISIIRYIALNKPIIFTIRTKNEGGFLEYNDIYSYIYREIKVYGIEFYDIEYMDENIKLIDYIRKSSNSRVILSKHYMNDFNNLDIMKKDLFIISNLNVDIVKYVTSVSDISKYTKLKYYIFETIKYPLIHFQIGEEYKLTRVINSFMTPVKDDLLGSTGAGQITFEEIRNLKNYPMKNYYVLGYPVTQSLSPEIYDVAFGNKNYNYKRKNILTVDDFYHTLNDKDTLFSSVTIPFKEKLFDYYSDDIVYSEETKYIRALNTIKKINGRLYCYNTDWVGNYELLVEAISKIRINLSEIRILIIGAGGAANSVIFSLTQLCIPLSNITIINRTSGKCKKYNTKYGINDNLENTYNLIISTIPKDAESSFLERILIHINQFSICVDLAYNRNQNILNDTNFRNITKQISDNYINGIEFLLKQAYYSYEIFSGRIAERNKINKNIYSLLNN